MRVEARHRDAGLGNTPLAQRGIQLVQGVRNQLGRDQAGDFAQRQVVCQMRHPQRARSQQQIALAGLDVDDTVEHARHAHGFGADRPHDGGPQATGPRQVVGFVQPDGNRQAAGCVVKARGDVGRRQCA